MKEPIYKILLIVFCFLTLGLSIRGLQGNPTSVEVNQNYWKDNGPLELSPERGRYGLTMSLVEDGSFQFSESIARFVTPDLGYKDGNYVSLFAPGVSFIVIPGYLLGNVLSATQVGTFAVISLFAIMNVLLIYSLSKLLGASPIAASIASLVYLFATPAFPYAVTLYQHHITTFIILLSLWLLMRYKSKLSLAAVWFLCAASIPVDYPNLFFMLPIGFYALLRVVDVKKYKKKYSIKFNPLVLLTFLTILIPLGYFLWFNQMSYGDPFQFSGTITRVQEIDEQGSPSVPDRAEVNTVSEFIKSEGEEKTSIGFFNTREILQLSYIHLLSPDRGVLFYSPIIYLGILGVWFLYKRQSKITSLLLAIVGFNILLYTMFGQGGWAFGSRYLIPTYAIMSVFLAIALTKFRKKPLVLFTFLILMAYSVSVNTLGALTTNRVPPKVEAVALEQITGRKEHYTYLRNWEFLTNNGSKSFVYQTFAGNYLTAQEYYFLITGAIVLVLSGQLSYLYLTRKEK